MTAEHFVEQIKKFNPDAKICMGNITLFEFTYDKDDNMVNIIPIG